MSAGTPRKLGWAGAALLACVGPARADVAEAISHLKAGKYLEAASELQVLVDRSPTYDYGHYLLGHCHLKRGNPAQAERSFARAIALDGGRPEYYHGLAAALKAQRRYADVLEAVARGEPLARDANLRFGFLSLRAAAEVSLHRWGEAAASMEKALELRRDPRVLRDLGRVYLVLGRNDRAAAAFAEAAALNPGDAGVRGWLVEATLRMAADSTDPARKRALYTEAFHLARRHAEGRPFDAAAANLVGRAALGAGLYAEAEAAFRDVLAADPGHCYARVNLAGVYIAQGLWNAAERSLVEASRCGPELGETFVRLGYVYLRQGRTGEAEQAFGRARELLPAPVAQRMVAEARSAGTSEGRTARTRPPLALRRAGTRTGGEGEVLVLERKTD